MARNFYKSARECSSSPELKEESFKIADNLLRCNGYSNPRDIMKTHIKGISGPPMDSSSVCLKLPYISEQISDQIPKFIKNCELHIRVVFTPGKKLRHLFCCSRPYDKPVCQICSRLVEGKDCSIMCPIYQITCNLCNELFPHDRLGENLRFSTNPSNPSYKNEAFAAHYGQHPPGQTPDLTFKLMKTERNTILRKCTRPC